MTLPGFDSRQFQLWSTPEGILSFAGSHTALIDPVGRTLRTATFPMPDTRVAADWVRGTTYIAWASGGEVGLIDASATPMQMINRQRVGPLGPGGFGLAGIAAVNASRVLVSGATGHATTIEMSVPQLVPTGYEIAGGGAIGVSPDGAWVVSETPAEPERVFFFSYGRQTATRVLNKALHHASPTTLRWTTDGKRVLYNNGSYSPREGYGDTVRTGPVLPPRPPSLDVVTATRLPHSADWTDLVFEPSTERVFIAHGDALTVTDRDGTYLARPLPAYVTAVAAERGAVFVLAPYLKRVDPVSLRVTGAWPERYGKRLEVVAGRVVLTTFGQVDVFDPATGTVTSLAAPGTTSTRALFRARWNRRLPLRQRQRRHSPHRP